MRPNGLPYQPWKEGSAVFLILKTEKKRQRAQSEYRGKNCPEVSIDNLGRLTYKKARKDERIVGCGGRIKRAKTLYVALNDGT